MSLSGFIFGSRLEVHPFKLNPFKTGNSSLAAVDVFRVFFMGYIIYIMVLKLCSQGNMEQILNTNNLFNVVQNFFLIFLQMLAIFTPV